MHLQLDVTAGCTLRLSDISGPLSISAVRVGRALDALHLRDRTRPTPEAISHGLGHRWFNGREYLVDWHIAGITEVVSAYYNDVGWPKPSPKASTPPCRTRRGAGR